MQPLDEVRSGAAVFDETLFRLAPSVYRALDLALQGESSGSVAPQAPAFLRFGSWIGADRDGNPFVTAAVTEQTARIQAITRCARWRTRPRRIGRSLTIDAALLAGPQPGGLAAIPAAAELLAALAAAAQAHPAIVGELSSRSPGEPFRAYLLLTAAAAAGDAAGAGRRPGCEPLGHRGSRDPSLAYASAAEFIADLRLVQRALAAAGAARQAYGELQHLIWQAETFGFHLAELEVRQHSAVHAAALRELREPRQAADRDRSSRRRPARCSTRWRRWRRSSGATASTPAAGTSSASPLRRLTSPPCTSWPGYACPDRPPVLDVVPLFESGDDLANAVAILDDMIALEPVARAPGRDRPAARGHARLLRLRQGARHGQRHAAAVRRAAPAGALGGRPRHQARAVPRPRRRARPRRRPGWPGRARAGARLGRRQVQGHRAGRGDLRPVRPPGHRPAPPRAGDVGGAARVGQRPARRRRSGRRRSRRSRGHWRPERWPPTARW